MYILSCQLAFYVFYAKLAFVGVLKKMLARPLLKEWCHRLYIASLIGIMYTRCIAIAVYIGN